MITKLRKRFIAVAMISLLIVMTLIVAAINIMFFYHNNRNQKQFIHMIKESEGRPSPPDAGEKEPGNIIPDGSVERPLGEREMKVPAYIEYGIIYFDENLELTKIYSEHINLESDETFKEYADSILAKSRQDGKIGNYKYHKYEKGDQTLIILLNDASAKASMRAVFLVTVSVALISYLLVFLLVVLISRRAIQPVAESYEKQKQFITDAGHELKTPLTVISANTEIARMTFGECEWFVGIDKQTKRMESLVKNLIVLSKMDEENTKLDARNFCISDALYDTAMTFKGPAESKNISLNVDIQNEFHFLGDESSIRQVFAILLDNAVKYCDENGEIDVRLQHGRNLTISVINTCKDVSHIELNRIFDRFYRADKSRSPGGGYGLGLSIAKAVIDRHHGSIKAVSEETEKIKFEITFP